MDQRKPCEQMGSYLNTNCPLRILQTKGTAMEKSLRQKQARYFRETELRQCRQTGVRDWEISDLKKSHLSNWDFVGCGEVFRLYSWSFAPAKQTFCLYFFNHLFLNCWALAHIVIPTWIFCVSYLPIQLLFHF